MVARGIHATGFLRAENVREAATRTRGHAGLRPRKAGQLNERRREVNEAHVVVHDATGLLDAARPHGSERDVVRGFVGAALAAREGHPVVGGDDDECVFEQPALRQFVEHPAEMPVEVLHLEGVVEQVVPHCLIVRPVGGHTVDVRELLAPLRHAGAELIATVWLDRAIPEGPRLVLCGGVEEVVEVGGIVVVADAGGRRRGFLRVERLAGHLPRLAQRIGGHTRTPALHRVTDGPAVFGERLAPAFELRREVADVVRRFLELPRVAASEDACAGRGALSIRGEGAGEQDAVLRHAVEVRRLHPLRAVSARVRAPVIGDGEENVRGPLNFSGGHGPDERHAEQRNQANTKGAQ